jgi:PAS domain S-box-containing protein
MTTRPGSGATAAGLADQLLAGVRRGLALLDESGGIRLANRAAEELFGYGPGQLSGRTLADLYPPEDRGRGAAQGLLAGARRDGRIEDEGWRLRRDGTRVRAGFVVALAPSPDRPGEDCFTLEIHETMVRPVEAALRAQLAREEEARERAEETSRARDEFLATLSHELRTPLTAIMGWAHLLRTGSLDEASRARALETIERNAHLEAQLLADVLDVARIITGKLRLQVQDVDAAPIVASAVDAVRQHAEQKRVSLSLTPPDQATAVAADPDRLQQVVANLLTNAIKFTPAGGEVRVRVAAEAHSVAIEVQDTGEGIPPEVLPHVFERFRQGGAGVHGKGGLGLGLAIVSHIVELHSGHVRADSEGPGRGSTFTVHLPSLAEPPAAGPAGRRG